VTLPIMFASPMKARLSCAGRFYIARSGIAAPPANDDPAEAVAPKIPSPPIMSLDVKKSGISTIVWCTGFDGDFSWVRVPGAVGADQQPLHVDGIGAASGVYFAGLDFASTRKSGTILSSIDESRIVVGHIQQRLRHSLMRRTHLILCPGRACLPLAGRMLEEPLRGQYRPKRQGSLRSGSGRGCASDAAGPETILANGGQV
jgi:hypothetical protein